MIPGEILPGDGPVEINAGRPVTTLLVVNTADRPIQVGSHYHFAETNPGLSFDRSAAYGQRLAVPAGTSVRFEPGISRTVDLVPLGGARIVPGLRGEVAGPLDREPDPSAGEPDPAAGRPGPGVGEVGR
ncbi:MULTISPECIES: urease subunit beta [Micromonospora]|uniref:Urease subunit beta n=1 Tax=Micromonospora rifamycinica TaxID=291594 RepID=A0A125Q1X6_9ACTN|nr:MULTISPECIES: urease subunit beta [Micromonospora]KWV33542.1 urease subunit beta [Micromonospora rifamycinica]WFE66072.1 urease subunit beta [Micromonospora sp. WMMD714]SCG39086.1 urease subunit beta [Micromonospora rifamycinica]